MKVSILPVTPLQQNCSILECQQTGRAAVVDPGGDADRIAEVLEELKLQCEKILVTHAHADHAGGVAALLDRFEVPVEGPHAGDLQLVRGLGMQGRMTGVSGAAPFEPDRWLEDGDTVQFGEVQLEVLHCPGHTPGHVAFFSPENRVVLAGDLVFQGSIGRTDFPGGSHETLMESIAQQIIPLGDDVVIVPGHGPPTTIEQERRTNPFLQGL